MNITTKQLAEKFNTDIPTAQGLLNFLRAANRAKVVGTVDKAPGAKGKPANIWEVPTNLLTTIEALTLPEVVNFVIEDNQRLAA